MAAAGRRGRRHPVELVVERPALGDAAGSMHAMGSPRTSGPSPI
ncbi:hypothetical protein SGUI_0463 [Serinicoccus hydrothermalis]|uniref:Uncharacterized protein n=1 Tax=Serinicoccus hydrothermalis TaxID=1758689 RepID=A0A1B1N8V5_9MICO|nr:hypothetical protein SGUI_0463 [Serinicoccus hydrothermalis]